LDFEKAVLGVALGAVSALSIWEYDCSALEAWQENGTRNVDVADAIEMTRLGDRYDDWVGTPAHYSPDGKRFFVLLKTGNLQENTNDFHLLFYRASSVLTSSQPEAELRMSSNSNRDAIHEVRWLGDGHRVAFIGENPNENSQVYTFDVAVEHLERHTRHATAISAFDITSDGRAIAFVAPREPQNVMTAIDSQRAGFVVTTNSIMELLGGSLPAWDDYHLFLQPPGQAERPVALENRWTLTRSSHWDTPHLSPDGRLVLICVNRRGIPPLWRRYRETRMQYGVKTDNGSGNTNFYIREDVLVDMATGSAKSLLDAPSLPWPEFYRLAWIADGEKVSVHSFLPLNENEEELEKETNAYDVEVDTRSGGFHKISASDSLTRPSSEGEPVVTVDEGIDAPPKLRVVDASTGAHSTLMDLNPQFHRLQFGRVEAVEWKTVRGDAVEGGLYYPSEYRTGLRYPLVIQTHGFMPKRFSMSGLLDWSSAYAARPLASRGFFVLQVGDYKNEALQNEAKNTPREAELEVAKYEAAIDYLSERNLIDPDRVGIVGFSRTFYHVASALIRSTRQFRAASLVDGIDASYLQFLMFGQADSARLNGGQPFGEGLVTWLKRAPGFNADKVRTPIRLVSTGSGGGWLSQWEWFALLKEMGKPVDFVYFPDAEHLMVKPWERRAAMEGLIDWCRFWLKDEQDPSPEKQDQYARWRDLKK
jgi:dipeptidyl aminopeptidase/acylaminoacyl peptidase